MAGTYITVSDIKDRNIKRFETVDQQDYVDRANEWFEDYAYSLGITDPNDIQTPVKSSVRQLILQKLYMMFNADAVNGGGTNTEGANMYLNGYELARSQFNIVKTDVTPDVITGSATTRDGHAVNMGRVVRG